MKPILIVLASFVSFSAIAQKKISLNQDINDNGKNLSIKIKGTINEKPIDYNRTFDVTGMTKEQKDELKRRIYDSLGLPVPVVPRAPLEPHNTITLSAPAEPSAPAVPVISSKSQYAESYTVGGDHPFTKEITYNPKTGILFMKYWFIKNGEEVTVEKSVDAKGKSKEEKDQIIKKYEKEIGILQPEII